MLLLWYRNEIEISTLSIIKSPSIPRGTRVSVAPFARLLLSVDSGSSPSVIVVCSRTETQVILER
jgi:hypothetical protein